MVRVVDDYVVRLDVAVHDAVGVAVVQGLHEKERGRQYAKEGGAVVHGPTFCTPHHTNVVHIAPDVHFRQGWVEFLEEQRGWVGESSTVPFLTAATTIEFTLP